MIVRTYGRRNRDITTTYSDTTTTFDDIIDVDADDPFRESLSQESPQDFYSIPLSYQDSSSDWAFDSEPHNPNSSQNSLLVLGDSPNGAAVRKSKKARNGKRESSELVGNSKGVVRIGSVIPMISTKTLMETQEFGEMMEHVDEVNFALDGLRKGQPARIRRASLLSLLVISSTAQQRRLLRTEGMAKTIIEAILNLSFDDSPSNLAAAALFYVLTSDGQEDNLLESPRSIKFLLNLLKPLISGAVQEKAPSIGCKLLAFRKDGDIPRNTVKSLDSSSAAISLKVQKILVSCKDLKSGIGDNNGMERPELSSKWIALLTMEKACLSTISLEDASGSIRKSGGNFKEKVQELGGLDAVFDVAMDCHSDMERWLEFRSPQAWETKDDADLRSLVLLLKCLKIMENATFLSKDNQSHLLQMKGKSGCQGSTLSFVRLLISGIKILSGLSLLRSSPAICNKACTLSYGAVQDSELPVMARDKLDNDDTLSITSSKACCSTGMTSPENSFDITRNSQWLSTVRSEYSISKSETTSSSSTDTCFLKIRANSSKSGSSSGTLRCSDNIISVKKNGSRKNVGLGRRHCIAEDARTGTLEDSQDPFAFDGDDFENSKWDLLSGKRKVSRTQKRWEPCRELEDEYQFKLMMSQQESSNKECNNSQNSCSAAVNEENANLIVDCLLTAIKVLMNLTNDNPVGCQQIAACGGLETMSSLIAGHFPSFTSSSSPFSEIEKDSLLSKSCIELDEPNDRHLNDQELDLLVAILGLLVNLVEKDGLNRSRLAAASVSLPSSEWAEEESRRDVIPLLCSIFLANQGAGEAAGEGKLVPQNDEEAVLQGEKEAEKMIIEAYAALLLAFLSTESKSIRDAITDCLPEHKLTILVPVLERFVEFHLTLNMISPETHIAVSEVIESCRI